jgi:hypothetical protein
MDDKNILKKKIFIAFTIMIILILGSGILGWILTQQVANSNKIIDTIHLLKESELQLRREEKNLLIRGYSQERYLRWQTAKEDFHQKFGELIGMKALTDNEMNAIKKDYSEMSETYKSFFDEILSKKLSQDEINNYDEQFKTIGRSTINMINNILAREQSTSDNKDSQADVVIVIFLIVFISTAGFLIVNVLKHL